jgi:hypothetical protein
MTFLNLPAASAFSGTVPTAANTISATIAAQASTNNGRVDNLLVITIRLSLPLKSKAQLASPASVSREDSVQDQEKGRHLPHGVSLRCLANFGEPLRMIFGEDTFHALG